MNVRNALQQLRSIVVRQSSHTRSSACMCTLNVVLLSYTPSQTWSTRDRGLRRDTKRSNDCTIQKQLLFSCCRFVRCLCVYSVHSLAVRWFWCLLRARTRSLCCATNEERWKKATTTLSSRSRTLNNIGCCVSLCICVHSTHPMYMHHISTLLLLNNYLAVFFFCTRFVHCNQCVSTNNWVGALDMFWSLLCRFFSSLILFCFFSTVLHPTPVAVWICVFRFFFFFNRMIELRALHAAQTEKLSAGFVFMCLELNARSSRRSDDHYYSCVCHFYLTSSFFFDAFHFYIYYSSRYFMI